MWQTHKLYLNTCYPKNHSLCNFYCVINKEFQKQICLYSVYRLRLPAEISTFLFIAIFQKGSGVHPVFDRIAKESAFSENKTLRSWSWPCISIQDRILDCTFRFYGSHTALLRARERLPTSLFCSNIVSFSITRSKEKKALILINVEICALLGLKQRKMVASYRHFGTTYRSLLDYWRLDLYVLPKRR